MINSRLIELLESLTKAKRTKLDSFLRSPYHNNAYNAEAIYDLFCYLTEALAEKDSAKLDKQVLNQRYFPDSAFVEKQKNPIDTLATHLLKQVRDFIHLEYLQNADSQASYYLSIAEYYRIHSMEERFWQTIKQFRKFLAQRAGQDAQFYLDSCLLEEEVATFRSIFNTYTDDANLVAAHQYLDQFYFTKKFEFSASLILQQQMGQVEVGEALVFSELLETAFDDFSTIQTPLAGLYKAVIELLREQGNRDQGLEAFRHLLESTEGQVNPKKYRNLMAFYRYFLVLQYRKEIDGSDLLYETYKEHLEKGYLLVGDQLLPTSLKNLINMGIKKGDIAWAKEVLADFPPERITGTRLPAEAHSLCEAEVLFANAEYEAANDKLTYQNFEDVNYSILADILLIKIYYATENELLHHRIRAVEQKVRRSKLSKALKASYLNFLRFLNQVNKYEHDRHHKKWLQLPDKLKTMVPMIEREWLQKLIS